MVQKKNGIFDVFDGIIDDVINKSDFLSENLGTVVENRNMANLKKNAAKKGNYLYVTREEDIGKGIYHVVDKNGEEIYNILSDFGRFDKFVLHLYSVSGQELADISKQAVRKKGWLGKSVTAYYYRSNVYPPGFVSEIYEGNRKQYVTEFNDWMVMGDFTSGNYKIFSRNTGKTIATVSKKFKKAATYAVKCPKGEDEAVIIFLTVLIDMLEKE